SLCLGLFLVNFEITVVGTALVAITNDLEDFARSSWVVTAYLLTYTGCLVIWARLSDLLGRKPTVITAFFIFAAFSGACGGARTMVQLIVFRVLQGIGGSGIYGLTTAMIYELVPPPKFPLYTTFVMILFAIAFALGPLLGGLITNNGSWKWVFLLNVPLAALCGIGLYFAVPSHFPYHGRANPPPRPRIQSFDILGSVLTLAGVSLLIAGLEEAASLLKWRNARVIGPLCGSGVAWLLFLWSQWNSSRPGSAVQSVFPWKFCTNRVIMGLFINTFLTGAVSVTCIVLIPLRYQTAAGLSPLQAGARLILFSVASPIGAILAAAACKKNRVAPLYLMLFGEILQIIGLVLATTLTSTNDRDWPGLYGLQVCIGFGMGLVVGTATLLTPAVVERKDLATGSAAVIQFRFLGGATILSIATAVGNSWVRHVVSDLLTTEELQGIFRSAATIGDLAAETEYVVRGHFVQSFNLQMRILLGVAVAAVFSSLLMWQKPQVKVP
ncbi:putative multidrug resistance protein fnx1, partial [Diaporthe sp. PMI_573]